MIFRVAASACKIAYIYKANYYWKISSLLGYQIQLIIYEKARRLDNILKREHMIECRVSPDHLLDAQITCAFLCKSWALTRAFSFKTKFSSFTSPKQAQ